MVKVFVMAGVPADLAKAFAQHVRDFDAANPGCQFEIVINAPQHSIAEAIRMMELDPPLDVMGVIAGKKPTCQ